MEGAVRGLESDDEIRGAACESAIELRKATGHDAVDKAARGDFAAAALLEGAEGEIAADGALVADHEQDALLTGDAGEALADGISGAKAEEVVVEEEDPGHFGAVIPGFKLREDHAGELGGGGEIGGEDVGDGHAGLSVWGREFLEMSGEERQRRG